MVTTSRRGCSGLLEGVVLHAFEGRVPFTTKTRGEIERLSEIYGLTLRAADSHHQAPKSGNARALARSAS
jgi:hypothetical protein